MESLRLGSVVPPIVTMTPTVTPLPTSTPLPTATPVTANVGEWIDAKGYSLRLEKAEVREPVTWPAELACTAPCVAVVAEVIPKQQMPFVTNYVTLFLTNDRGQRVWCPSVTADRYRDEHGLSGKSDWAAVGQSAWILWFCEPGEADSTWQKGPLYISIGSSTLNDAAEGAEGKRVRLGMSLD